MNKLQKRALRKKRHLRQQYLKHEAPLDRLEHALGGWCDSYMDGHRCTLSAGHRGTEHMAIVDGGLLSWS